MILIKFSVIFTDLTEKSYLADYFKRTWLTYLLLLNYRETKNQSENLRLMKEEWEGVRLLLFYAILKQS